MMIQDYIAYLIIIVAFGILGFKILSFFNVIGKKSVAHGNCSGCSTGCEMKEIHLLNKPKFSKKDQYKFYL
jgi:hypothetical protein